MPDPTTQRAAGPGDERPSNTLRLEGPALLRVQDALDAKDALHEKGASARREYRRWQFRHPAVRMDVQHPGGQVVSLMYACRNLSSGGLAVLHSAYMHPGTHVSVHLKHRARGYVVVTGVARRCSHIRGRLHEIGVKFNEPVDVAAYMDVDPFRGQFSVEAVRPERLTGKLLHVEDGPMDRRLLLHILEVTRVAVTAASTGAEGLARAREPWNMVIIDANLPGQPGGVELVEKFRGEGVQVPILLVAADRGEDIRQKARAVRASGLLCKPFKGEVLLAALAEFLLAPAAGGDGAGSIVSTLGASDPLLRFVPDFVKELQQAATRVRAAVKNDDLEAARLECYQIVGVAGTLGFEAVSRAADEALRAVVGANRLLEASRPMQDLIAACMRVRLGKAA